jgi:transposase-like protein
MIAMTKELRKVIRRLHYPLEVMLICVRWYAALSAEFGGVGGVGACLSTIST